LQSGIVGIFTTLGRNKPIRALGADHLTFPIVHKLLSSRNSACNIVLHADTAISRFCRHAGFKRIGIGHSMGWKKTRNENYARELGEIFQHGMILLVGLWTDIIDESKQVAHNF
jgi:hypothetical protein